MIFSFPTLDFDLCMMIFHSILRISVKSYLKSQLNMLFLPSEKQEYLVQLFKLVSRLWMVNHQALDATELENNVLGMCVVIFFVSLSTRHSGSDFLKI